MGDRVRSIVKGVIVGGVCLTIGDGVLARPSSGPPKVSQSESGQIEVVGDGAAGGVGAQVFDSWQSYVRSDFFKQSGLRCGLPPAFSRAAGGVAGGGGGDCTYTFTDPAEIYDPSIVRYRIPVVVHVIRSGNGTTGNVSENLVQSQIEVLNEDFLALAGTNGEPGTDVQIEFHLVTEDPDGNPTNGITYSNNTTWFNDGGSYWNQLAWDTNRYLNIYTNTAGGALGYVPDLPQGGIAGSNEDRVVILWSSFGRNAPIGPPFNQGRTLTHEVGHYLGLEHTFNGGCGNASSCYTTGDLICDTEPQSNPTDGCGGSSCGSPNPIHNYMDYSDDLCMWEFTPEQTRRMRCSLEHYRPLLYEVAGDPVGACCQGGDCSVLSEPDCVAGGGSFLGLGSSCAGNPCSTATGACCDEGGSCTVATSFDCAASGGSYQGDETSCDQPCPVATGACCLAGGSCQVESASDCADAGGSYQGDGTGCGPSTCGSQDGCGSPDAGDCGSANGSPYCSDAACCETVCQADPFCCDTEWDGLCADQAAELCDGGGGGDPQCGDPDAGDCGSANGTPYCSDATCCETVCQADPFCCDTEWDDLCADQAAELCDGGGGGDSACGSSDAGDCGSANGTPFCSDAACCATVCEADPFCCETEWDGVCAEQTAELCDDGGSGGDCPADLTGDGWVNVDDLLEMLLGWGEANSPGDLNGDGVVDVDDVVVLLMGWGPCG